MPRLAQSVEISREALFSTLDISVLGFLLLMVLDKLELFSYYMHVHVLLF
jgi:hypothetical protein